MLLRCTSVGWAVSTGRDVGVLQGLRDVGGAVVGAVQAFEGQRQRAFLQVTGLFVHGATAHVVAVFGDVGQVAEVAEGADHGHRLVGREVLQQTVQHAAGAGIGLQAVGHRELAHPFDELEGGRPSCSRITSPRMRPSNRISSTSGLFLAAASF
jgi:hypothetical protein